MLKQSAIAVAFAALALAGPVAAQPDDRPKPESLPESQVQLEGQRKGTNVYRVGERSEVVIKGDEIGQEPPVGGRSDPTAQPSN